MSGRGPLLLQNSRPGTLSFRNPPETTTLRTRYDASVMAKAEKTDRSFEVACPCCAAVLKVDAATGAVIAHTPPPRQKTFADFEAAAKAMKEQEGRKESLFRQSVEAERNKADLLEKKFQEAVKRAREAPDEPRVRDIDLD